MWRGTPPELHPHEALQSVHGHYGGAGRRLGGDIREDVVPNLAGLSPLASVQPSNSCPKRQRFLMTDGDDETDVDDRNDDEGNPQYDDETTDGRDTLNDIRCTGGNARRFPKTRCGDNSSCKSACLPAEKCRNDVRSNYDNHDDDKRDDGDKFFE